MAICALATDMVWLRPTFLKLPETRSHTVHMDCTAMTMSYIRTRQRGSHPSGWLWRPRDAATETDKPIFTHIPLMSLRVLAAPHALRASLRPQRHGCAG